MIYLQSFQSNKKYKISVQQNTAPNNRCINIDGGLETSDGESVYYKKTDPYLLRT